MEIFKVFFFIFGSLIGSFINVVIYRLPLGESIVFPRSKCPNCKSLIPFYFNIPILGFFFSRMRCFSCKEKISFKYPLTELVFGLASLYLFPEDLSPDAIFGYAFNFSLFAAMYAHFFIDLKHQILPDKINLYLLIVILPVQILMSPISFWLFGGLIGFFVPLIVTYIFYKLRGVVGLGGGDIKLYGLIGLLLGPYGVMATIFMSSLFGSLVGLILIVMKKMHKSKPMAFGPYIILIFLFQYFFPEHFSLINPFVFE